MKGNRIRVGTLTFLIMLPLSTGNQIEVDLLLRGGTVYDGTGSEPKITDIGITGDRITFIGDASLASLQARDTLNVSGSMVTPGFIDMHSHAELDRDYGRDALPFIYQGITTAVIGVDGGGTPKIAEKLDRFLKHGIGINAVAYVGHGAIRRQVLGMDDRVPSAKELQQMRNLVRQAMEEGALGLSTGLFYTPGFYAETDEVIELAKVAAEYDGIYDTHDRDLGAAYKGVGYLNSIREAIEIGEKSKTRVIFSHFNAQGAHNYGRAHEGARLVEEARSRSVRVEAAQHVYTATQSSLRAYAIPRWAVAGGHEAMLRRFDDPDTARILDVQTVEMLQMRGGAEKILFADPRPDLNGRTLAQVATEWNLPVPATVRRILRDGNAVVMNLDLYDIENTRLLAQQPWMMTCTDGRTPRPGQEICHPRVYGAFTRKLRKFALEEGIISMPFAIRSMTGLAADFLKIPDRGYLKAGMIADIAVFDQEHLRDLASFEAPHQYSAGTVHVLVNGTFVLKNGKPTNQKPGRPLVRGGKLYAGTVAPPPLASHVMAYHTRLEMVVLFGGSDPDRKFSNTLWGWDGRNWHTLSNGGPAPRIHTAMAYHEQRDRLVLYGGIKSREESFGDTWEWDGSGWIERSISGVGPGVRDHHAMAYDPGMREVLLFGGQNQADEFPQETWTWDGDRWRLVAREGPEPRSTHRLAYDAAIGRVVLYGGWGKEGHLGDTWEWTGRQWLEIEGSNPPARGASRLAATPELGHLVLFGGLVGRDANGETWIREERRWRRLEVTGPPARNVHGMAYDASRRRVVMYGGLGKQGRLGDVWERDGRKWYAIK